MDEATEAVQLETSRCQNESPYKGELELLRVRCGMRLDGTLIRPAIKTGKAGDWSELAKSDRLTAWTTAKLQECYSEVEQEDDERKCIVLQNLQESTDVLRRVTVPGRGHTVVHVPSQHPVRFNEAREESVQLVACGVRRAVRLGEPEPSLDSSGQHAARRRCFGAQAPPQGLCENPTNALKLPSNQQTGGDSWQCWLRAPRTKRVGDGGAEKVHHGGHSRGCQTWRLGENIGVTLGGGTKFNTDFPEAAIREGAELTLRRGEERYGLSAPSPTPPMWGTMGTVTGGRGLARRWPGGLTRALKARRERSWCHKNAEMREAVDVRQPGNHHKARACWMLRDAKTDGEAHCERSGGRQNEGRATVRQALWEAHVQSPTAALEEAVEKLKLAQRKPGPPLQAEARF